MTKKQEVIIVKTVAWPDGRVAIPRGALERIGVGAGTIFYVAADDGWIIARRGTAQGLREALQKVRAPR
ncbi:MAG: hypothetical protein IT379_11895 [Deltaproteobacteria bacterium]|nr:hypothetical protein [Deltaproteobacteria bacterium]